MRSEGEPPALCPLLAVEAGLRLCPAFPVKGGTFMTSLHRALVVPALLAVSLVGSTLSAQVVVNNGTPDNRDGYVVYPPYSSANDFSLTGTTSLGFFNWWAIPTGSTRPNTVTAQYFLRILMDADGFPDAGASVFSMTVNGIGLLSEYGCCGGGTASYPAYAFSADLGGFTLDAGNYWIAVSDMSSTDGGAGWYWSTSNGLSGNQFVFVNGSWQPTYVEGAFNITGPPVTATPEPATLSLMATGLFSLGGMVRRRRKAAADAAAG